MRRTPDDRRIATCGDTVLHGRGVKDDRNGAFTLVFRIDGIQNLVVLDTRVWKVRWEEQE